jgi:polysaccharide pyruvyl transferase WcaK-like protein
VNRVFLAGYYGMHNTGDDAMLAAAAWGIRQYLAPDRILVNVACLPEFPGAEHLTPIYAPVQRFKGENRLRGYRAVLLSRSLVYGGGSLFHTSSVIRSHINQLKLAGKGPHYAVGVALGPFGNIEDERTCAGFLRRLEFIGLRDRESLEIARTIAPEVRSEKTFDLALLFPRSAGLNIGDPGIAGQRRGIGLSLCDYERFSGGDLKREETRRKKLIELLRRLDPAGIDELVFMDFNGHPVYGDRKLHEEIAASLDNRFKVRHLPYCADPLTMLRAIASLRLVLAMRLHAAIFGYLAHTPTFILSYHPKCTAWAKEIGTAKQYLYDSVDFELSSMSEQINSVLDGNYLEPGLAPASAEAMAMKNWTALNSL